METMYSTGTWGERWEEEVTQRHGDTEGEKE